MGDIVTGSRAVGISVRGDIVPTGHDDVIVVLDAGEDIQACHLAHVAHVCSQVALLGKGPLLATHVAFIGGRSKAHGFIMGTTRACP